MDARGNQNLSSVLGWVSIACWLVVYSPQIIENYQLKSGEGLSVPFVVIWLAGDLCSLTGSVLAGLLPNIIILSAYYAVCDSILLFQIYYYRRTNPALSKGSLLIPDEPPVSSEYPDESIPLLDSQGEKANPPMVREVIKYAGALVFVSAVGVVAWTVDEYFHKGASSSKPDEVLEWKSQALGWASAAMFLGARIPQIVKNVSTRCAGLSPFLFVYSITGNTTYFLAILAASMDMKHLIANASWIAGSTLTVFLDVFVLCQFMYYQTIDRRTSHRRAGC
ncbi:Probable vacuolar amino acid transporter [Sparassis crispa]|uniref:Probable vacuolar amino acid transporter n=1 Tax=Sparassis crispa TaxID=139825 RepID=A0A401GS54_9APHY|nr:Probable vacuolar amino acid transporter [Sparassis crispa]GBE85058.1 Probable vacuolar amino acid transporter [Sparassis crispa]